MNLNVAQLPEADKINLLEQLLADLKGKQQLATSTSGPLVGSTYVAIVLDRSGSMSSVQNEAVSGFNEQLDMLKEKERNGAPTKLSIVVFNQDVQTLASDSPPSMVQPLTRETYTLNGGTAMLDAVGKTILDVTPKVGANDAAIIIVISDGEENSSREFSYEALAKLIKDRQDSGKWTFTYMLSNQDLSLVTQRLNLNPNNVVSYNSTQAGTRGAMRMSSQSLGRFLDDRMTKGITYSANLYTAEERATLETTK